eukprot:5076945-Pyramimonas_sp.AAC.3
MAWKSSRKSEAGGAPGTGRPSGTLPEAITARHSTAKALWRAPSVCFFRTIAHPASKTRRATIGREGRPAPSLRRRRVELDGTPERG